VERKQLKTTKLNRKCIVTKRLKLASYSFTSDDRRLPVCRECIVIKRAEVKFIPFHIRLVVTK